MDYYIKVEIYEICLLKTVIRMDIHMWPLFKRRKEQKIEDKEKIKVVKLGEAFNLEPGETASVEIPVPTKIIDGHTIVPGNIGKIFASYKDKYGNIYEIEAEVDIKDIIDNRAKQRIKSKTKIVYYGPFKKRIPMIMTSILIVGIIGIIAFLVTDSVIPIITGIGIIMVLEIIIEIFYKRVNARYNRANRIDIVKEV